MLKKNGKEPETLDDVLETLSNVELVKKAVIFTDDGEIIRSSAVSDDESFAQESACRMAAEEGISFDIGDEPPDDIIIASASKRITVRRVKPEILLAVSAELEANQQFVSTEMKRAATEIKKLLEKKKG